MKKKLLKAINSFLIKRGYRLSTAKVNVHTSADLMLVMTMLRAKKNQDLTVVQVGANDGKTHDPIYDGVFKYANKVLLIEPQEELIPLLKNNYKDYNGTAIIEQKAINSTTGILDFFTVDEETRKALIIAGNDPSLFASFSKDHVVYHLMHSAFSWNKEKALRHVISTPIAAQPLEQVVKQHSINKIDLLQIDCEGYDWQVLKTIGQEIRPTVINLEYKHLSDGDKAELKNWLTGNQYQFVLYGRDCFAIYTP